MSVKEYVEANGYKVSDLTDKELSEVKEELAAVESGEVILEGFFSPMSEFSQRMLQG